jgi:putative salt-induced outer membrane protein
MKTRQWLLPLLSLALLPSLAVAQDNPPPAPDAAPAHHEDESPNILSGGAELNFSQTTGNTKIQAIGGSAHVDNRAGAFENRLKATYLRNAVRDTEEAESLDTNLRTGTHLANNIDVWAQGNFYRNQFSGIDQEWLGAAGVGLYPFASEALSLDVELGPGFVRENLTPGGHESFIAGLVGADFKVRLSDTADFLPSAIWIYDFRNSDDWRLNAEVAIAAKVTSILSTKIGFNFRRRNEPVEGYRPNDTATTAALVIKF